LEKEQKGITKLRHFFDKCVEEEFFCNMELVSDVQIVLKFKEKISVMEAER